jgi:protein-L-isoaspartate(D-aspartate) O-methyltransferase
MNITMNYEQARFNMIEQQIRPWDVLDPEVLNLLGAVKREDFVPAAYRNLAFSDLEIPLGDVAKGESMLAPKIEARILQELALHKTDHVLEIGTGSGYMAALLAHRSAQVTTLEINPQLATSAKAHLAHAGLSRVDVQVADGSHMADAEGYDVIVLSGSVAQIPPSLLAKLKLKGRMAAFVGNEPVMQAQIITRVSDTQFNTRVLFEVIAPRLQGFAEVATFKF